MRLPLLLLGLLPLGACSCDDDVVYVESRVPRTVSIEVEIYDPVTNRVWIDAPVRIVEAELEWSRLIVRNPDTTAYYLTNDAGRTVFTSYDLSAARVGFVTDSAGRAVLEPDGERDEGYVLLEVAAPGFETAYMDVYLSWANPDAFVEIPFRQLPPE